MSRAFEDEQDKQARMEAARKSIIMVNKNVITVDIYFTQIENDPEQFVCDKCIEHAMNRD